MACTRRSTTNTQLVVVFAAAAYTLYKVKTRCRNFGAVLYLSARAHTHTINQRFNAPVYHFLPCSIFHVFKLLKIKSSFSPIQLS